MFFLIGRPGCGKSVAYRLPEHLDVPVLVVKNDSDDFGKL